MDRSSNPEEDALSTTSWLFSRQSNDVFTFWTFQYFLTCVLPDSKPCGGGGGLKSQGPLTAWELTGINFRCNRSVFQKIKKQLLREVVWGRHTCCCCWRYTLTEFQNSREIMKKRFSTDGTKRDAFLNPASKACQPTTIALRH